MDEQKSAAVIKATDDFYERLKELGIDGVLVFTFTDDDRSALMMRHVSDMQAGFAALHIARDFFKS